MQHDYPNIRPELVEKDYWIMHVLSGLTELGYTFYLKGGTSLSKGFHIIDRFSEDIDILIQPKASDEVYTGKNHVKKQHIESRKKFFDDLAREITIPDMQAERDHEFDDEKFRSAGIRLKYDSCFENDPVLKEGVLLEVGFDKIEPNEPCNITSWAVDKYMDSGANKIKDNRANEISCYYPEYTFVEKLQTVSTKVRKQQATGKFPAKFLRHYYDIYQLLKQQRVVDFLGTDKYYQHKEKRFRSEEKDLTKNIAFNLDNDTQLFKLYTEEYQKIQGLCMKKMPTLKEIFQEIKLHIEIL